MRISEWSSYVCSSDLGRIVELYKIFVVNFLLGLITLGIYRFWGKTRMRLDLWWHLGYDGDRFEYTGTGGELFKGFLIVAVILILLTLVNTGAQFAIEILVRDPAVATIRSAERRVGKECVSTCRSRWYAYHSK